MRLPWQKESSDTRKQSLKDMMSVGNASTGSFESPTSDRSKLSKLRKEMKKSDEGSSSEDKSPFMHHRKPSLDNHKADKTSASLDVPKVSKHRRKSIDVASLSEASMKEFQNKFNAASNTSSTEVLPIPVPIAHNLPASTGGSQVVTPEDKKAKEKKKKKPKGLGPKPPKMCKDGKIRRVVSFNEFVERQMASGQIEKGPINVMECAKGEIPYHKRGKEEYKMKKALIRAARIAAGDKLSEDELSKPEEEDEPPPSFSLMISSEDDDSQLGDPNIIDITKHSINFLGPVPQSQVLNNNGLNITIQSFSISRYSPDIKGILVIGNSQKILPSSDETHFLKTDIHLYFDDWDTNQSVAADKMDPGVLNMMLRNTPIADPLKKDNMYQILENPDPLQNEEKTGLLFTIPLEELFLPSLYEMLKEMDMEPNQPKFEVEGVIVLAITVYKSIVLFRGSSLEGLVKEKIIDQTLDKLESLTLQNSLSNEKIGSLEKDSFTNMYNPDIQITRSSVTGDPRNTSAPELPKINSDEVSSDSSQEVGASLDALPIWRVRNSAIDSPKVSPPGSHTFSSNELSPASKSPNSRQRSRRNSISDELALDDQLVLSTKFEIGFKVEKSPDGGIKSFDLLHVGYQKPK
jgi:hypothetical protein